MYITSLRLPCRNSLFTSISLIGQLLVTAKVRTSQIVISLITGLIFFMKSRPSSYIKPLATKRDLCCSIILSDLRFVLNTHLT
jgi:hypothetical protein